MDIGYNSVKANGVYNASSTPDFDYSRVVEGGNKFVNYLRNPISRGLSYNSIPYRIQLTQYTYATFIDESTIKDDYKHERRSGFTVYWNYHQLVYYYRITVDKYNYWDGTTVDKIQIYRRRWCDACDGQTGTIWPPTSALNVV